MSVRGSLYGLRSWPQACESMMRRVSKKGKGGKETKGGFIISTWIQQINRDASTRVPLCVSNPVKSHPSSSPQPEAFVNRFLLHPQRPQPHKEGSRSLSSLHSRDRPRAHLCRHRWWRRTCTLVNSTSFVVRPKLSPTVTASTFEVICTSHCEVRESRCRCQRHCTIVSLGYRTETLEPINTRSTKHNGATDARTSWIRRSLSRNLLEHVDVALTFCGH